MKICKRLFAMLLVVLLLGGMSANAYYYSSYYNYKVGYTDSYAFDYEYGDYPLYEVKSENYTNGRYLIYMYDRPSSSGDPISHYDNGELVRVIQEYPYGDQTYVYAIGPDGYLGFLRKAWLREYSPYGPDGVWYEVTSEIKVGSSYGVYMYPVASSQGDPNSRYKNGEIVLVLDPYSNDSYAHCIGQDGKEGYILRRRLTRCWWN